MQPAQFIQTYDNKPVWLLDDPASGNKQCVALFWKFNQLNQNETYSAVAAIDLWAIKWNSYKKIPTTQSAVLGDWCIWSGTFGAYTNYLPALGRGMGHVAMFVSDNGNGTGEFFSQNPGNADIITLSYDGIVGYLRAESAVPYFMTGLANELRALNTGLKIVEVTDWKTRGWDGRGITQIRGVMWHHTATGRAAFLRSIAPTLGICTYGHATLPGPLCHLLFARDGTVYVVAAGWANHAGTGKWTDIPWHRGNDHTIGIEMESSGVTPYDWTPEQIKWAPVLAAALRRIFAIDNDMSHLQYSDAGKPDPAGFFGNGAGGDMVAFRREITRVYNQGVTPTPPAEKDIFDMITEAQLAKILDDFAVRTIKPMVRDEVRRLVGDVVTVPDNQGTPEERAKNPTWTLANAITNLWRAVNAIAHDLQELRVSVGQIQEQLAKLQLAIGQIDEARPTNLDALIEAKVSTALAAIVPNLQATVTLTPTEEV